ncbi:hypothetical protein P154DRAFT_518066 [Amniculicola lignicola CBS 123094]|uniref:2EXR domain-containing protein n=1 Tax=Amniculicola lignicola CBS 123094 TaxID=1392246 RepID=A0A6A5WVJ6_9PLEO|nr:hypothetical protein P154DRAFT_518066 [Amniculicola lignicola CBS 123094]
MATDATNTKSIPSRRQSILQSTTTTLPDAPEQQSFPFQSLPAELRLQIYSHLLYDPTTYVLPFPRLRPVRVRRSGSKSLHPVILRINKQVHSEALPVLYSKNIWMIRTFPLDRYGQEMTNSIGAINAGLIRRVFISVSPLMATCDQLKAVVKEELWAVYAKMGIKGDELTFWGWRCHDGETSKTSDKDGEKEKWVETVEGKDIEKFGIRRNWWRQDREEGDMEVEGESQISWGVMKGSVGTMEEV